VRRGKSNIRERELENETKFGVLSTLETSSKIFSGLSLHSKNTLTRCCTHMYGYYKYTITCNPRHVRNYNSLSDVHYYRSMCLLCVDLEQNVVTRHYCLKCAN
jgi:hypothetical protein